MGSGWGMVLRSGEGAEEIKSKMRYYRQKSDDAFYDKVYELAKTYDVIRITAGAYRLRSKPRKREIFL